MADIQFVGQMAEMRVVLGDTIIDGQRQPVVIVDGVMRHPEGERPLKEWEVEMLILRALSLKSQQKGLAESPPSPILIASR